MKHVSMHVYMHIHYQSCLSGCNGRDVTSATCTLGIRLYNAYAGNKSPSCCSGQHSHLYRAIATVTGGYKGGTGDTRASKDCYRRDGFIVSYQGKAEV